MEIDGFWISDYIISADSNKTPFDPPMIIYAERDSIFIKVIGDPMNGLNGGELKTTFNYTKNGVKLKGKDLEELIVLNVSKDSLILNQYNDKEKEVFRRLTPTEILKNWSPSNKSFYWTGNTSQMNTNFIDNGLFVDYFRNTENISIGRWETFSLKKHTILNLNILYPKIFPIDSIKQNKIYLSIFDRKKYNYVFKEYSPKIPKELLGEWILTGSKYINGNGPPPPFYPIDQNIKPEIEYFKIELDSIKTIKRGETKTRKWVLGGDNNLIIFPYLKPTKVCYPSDSLSIVRKEFILKRNILKINHLTEKKLELLQDYDPIEYNGFARKLIFKRKK